MQLKFNPNKLSLGLVVVIIQTFLYVNAPAIFGQLYYQQAQQIILLYMIMTFAFTLVTNFIPPDIKQPAIPELLSFFVWFFVFAGILHGINFQTEAHVFQVSETVKIALPFMLLFAFVVAYTEELVFRGVLPVFLTDVGANVLFGLFHYYAYQGNVISIIIAILFGFIFSIVRDKFGLMGSVGMHTAWNLRILGAF